VFLDTSFCIDIMRERKQARKGPASRKLESLGETPLYISLFVACELQAGARLSGNPEAELRKVELFSELVEIVLPDRSFAVAYGEAEALLRRNGLTIPTMDLLIGLTAKQHGLPLLTADDVHFRRIRGLVVETYR
jgi:predicted nucleic acid-binding protein